MSVAGRVRALPFLDEIDRRLLQGDGARELAEEIQRRGFLIDAEQKTLCNVLLERRAKTFEAKAFEGIPREPSDEAQRLLDAWVHYERLEANPSRLMAVVRERLAEARRAGGETRTSDRVTELTGGVIDVLSGTMSGRGCADLLVRRIGTREDAVKFLDAWLDASGVIPLMWSESGTWYWACAGWGRGDLRGVLSEREIVAEAVRAPEPTVYFVRAETGAIKIGQAKNVAARLSSLRTGSAVRLELLGVTDNYAEAALHKRFAHLRLRGEWFSPGEDLLEFIRTETREPSEAGR